MTLIGCRCKGGNIKAIFVPHVTHVLGREEIVDGQVVDLVGTQARAVNDEAADVVVGRIHGVL